MTTSLEPTHRHCPPPACCPEWQSHCPCSSCTYTTNSHPRLHAISSANRKIIIISVNSYTILDDDLFLKCTLEKFQGRYVQRYMQNKIQCWILSFQTVPWSEFHVGEGRWSVGSPCRCRSRIPTPRPSLWPSGILFPRWERTLRMPRFLQLRMSENHPPIRRLPQKHIYNVLQRKTMAKNLKCVRLLSALGSVGVLLPWGLRELWGNLNWHTQTHIRFVTPTPSKANFSVRASANPVKGSHSFNHKSLFSSLKPLESIFIQNKHLFVGILVLRCRSPQELGNKYKLEWALM